MASVSPFGGLPSGACGRRISFDSLCLCGILKFGSDTGIRTRVSAVRGRRPGPLDDIAKPRYTTERRVQLAVLHFPMSKKAPQDGRPAASPSALCLPTDSVAGRRTSALLDRVHYLQPLRFGGTMSED